MALKRTGVQLVAEGGPQFLSTMSDAEKRLTRFGDAAAQASNKVLLLSNSSGKITGSVDFGSQVENQLKKVDQLKTPDLMAKIFGQEGAGREQISRALTGGFMAVDAVLTGIGDKADADTRKFIDMGRAAQNIALSFAFGGVVGGLSALGGLGLGLIVSQIQEASQRVENIKKPFEDLRAELDKMQTSSDAFAASLQKTLGVSQQEAESMSALAKSSAAYREELSRLISLKESQALVEDRIAKASYMAAQKPTNYGVGGGVIQARQEMQFAGEEARMLASATRQATEAALQHAAAARTDAAALAFQAMQAQEAAQAYQEYAAQMALEYSIEGQMSNAGAQDAAAEKALGDQILQTKAALIGMNAALQSNSNELVINALNADAAAAAHKDFADQMALEYEIEGKLSNTGIADAEKYRQKGEAILGAAQKTQSANSILQGLVEKAMTPTAVTQEDLDAAKAGKATPTHWDEFARRAEAVSKGTAPGTYGPEFEKQIAELQKMGYTAEQAAASFRDFSLFSDPKNLNLIDWGPITASVEQQLLSIAGKANATQEALKQVWANLSPTAKAALAKAGINNEEDALKALINPAGTAADKVGDLNTAAQQLAGEKKTTFVGDDTKLKPVLDSATTQINDFISQYGSVTISIHAEASASAPTGAPGPEPWTGPTGVPAPAPAPPTPTPSPGNGPVPYATGGWGITTADQYHLVHKGEGFWYSGQNWTVGFPGSFLDKMAAAPATPLPPPAPTGGFKDYVVAPPATYYGPGNNSTTLNAPITFGAVSVRSEADLQALSAAIRAELSSLRANLWANRRIRGN